MTNTYLAERLSVMSILPNMRCGMSTLSIVNMTSKQRWLLTGLLIPAAFGAFMFGRSLWWELRPFPNYPSLIKHPDERLMGTVAFFDSFPDNCLHIVSASGGSPRKVKCLEGEVATWLPDGRVQVTSYANRNKNSDDTRVIVDVETGKSVPVRSEAIPPWSEVVQVLGPNGEQVRVVSRRGVIKLFLRDINGERELLSVGAPSSYTFGYPSWSPTGEWFVVKDGLDRLLTITTGATPTVRVLAKNAWGQAVTGLSFINETTDS